MFRTVLVANRGEIAVRIMRTCRELGIRTVAVFSDADRDALHVRSADAAARIGPAPARESYLSTSAVLEAARRSGADAIHPGYGFLSENPEFAEACAVAGFAFIGPSPQAMRLLADKTAARGMAGEIGVPVLPGVHEEAGNGGALLARAREIGFPLMVKAAAGGGGRGMRLVEAEQALPDALASARREALAAFGDERLLLERAVVGGRHIEVQVLGDRQGNMIHLGERDCSIQRRYQKVIEESPSPAVTPELRDRLTDAALRVARAAGYENAGTVEFLVDRDGGFSFLEMNARLQVEHGVSELVTGLDLVALQLAIAAGEPLGLRQEDVRFDGHAIECRVYAEDPTRAYAPSAGRLSVFEPPSGAGIRNDVGVEAGALLPPPPPPPPPTTTPCSPSCSCMRPRGARRSSACVMPWPPTRSRACAATWGCSRPSSPAASSPTAGPIYAPSRRFRRSASSLFRQTTPFRPPPPLNSCRATPPGSPTRGSASARGGSTARAASISVTRDMDSR